MTKNRTLRQIFHLQARLALPRRRLTAKLWPVRLSVRTPGFQPGKRGSIPLRAATLYSFIKTCTYDAFDVRTPALFKVRFR